jgi:hypothetical protein
MGISEAGEEETRDAREGRSRREKRQKRREGIDVRRSILV